MKLSTLKEKLENKVLNKMNKLPNKKSKATDALDKIKIIGITGSYGKSSVAVMIHEYLKKLGYKSVLYSSAYVDSPYSTLKANEAYEVAIKNEASLLRIISEASDYQADYLVLEVNESTIKKGLVKDLPFIMKVLTNLNSKHNLDEYSEDEYINLKKSFFTGDDNTCIHVFGFQDYEKELYNELLKLSNNQRYTFSTKYVARVKGVDEKNFTTLLYDLNKNSEKTKLKVKLNKKDYDLQYPSTRGFNVFNMLCVLTILDALKLLDLPLFEKYLEEVKIPGRCEIRKVNNRLIVVDATLSSTLEYLKDLKEKGEVDRIVVLTGSMGSGFYTWEERFNSGLHFKMRHESRKYAMELVSKYADLVYLTENDNAGENVVDICEELKSYLSDDINVVTITNRIDAIKQVLLNSKEKDAIFISGRGNRRILCDSNNTMKLFKDCEAVDDTLKELGW